MSKQRIARPRDDPIERLLRLSGAASLERESGPWGWARGAQLSSGLSFFATIFSLCPPFFFLKARVYATAEGHG